MKQPKSMKIVTDYAMGEHAPIDYHGITVWLPVQAGYVTTDGDGAVHWHTHEPYQNSDYASWLSEGHYHHIGRVSLEGIHWENTLVVINNGATT